MSAYSYKADDQSLLTPFMYKCFVNPLLKVIPMSVPANIITLISNSFVLIAFLIAYFNYLNATTKFFWLIPILCFSYVVGDCSDGLQARRTGTGSPLGEYFDHFLDSFVTGFITGIFLLCFRVTNPIIIFLLYQLLYIGQIGTFWERLHLGVMKFFKISTTEGVVSLSVFAALYALEPIRQLNAENLIRNFSIFELMILFGYLIAGITGFITIIQTKKISFRLFLHIALSFIVGAVLVWQVQASILFCTIIISFYNVFFIASILETTNEGGRERFPDIIIPMSCVLFFTIPNLAFQIQIFQAVYLFFRILVQFELFLKKHKDCWYWKNPKMEEKVN